MKESRFEVAVAKAQVCLEGAVVSSAPMEEAFLGAVAGISSTQMQSTQDKAAQLKSISADDGSVVEQALRGLLSQLVQAAVTANQPIMQYCHGSVAQPSVPRLLDMTLWLAVIKQSDKGMVPGLVGLLEDLVETSTISDCQQVFSYMEAAMPLLRQPELFAQGKLVLLRTCNLLLRRLSKGFHAQMCGRVLIFLAKLYPLSERSGVNLHATINTANVTLLEDLPSDAKDSEGQPLDVPFYKTFWGLQSMFQRPTEALQPATWTQAVADIKTVLKQFAATPIAVSGSTPWSQGGGEHLTVKYLSSSKLLKLQLRDASLRRHVLVQALAFLHACQHPSKPDKAATADKLLPKQVTELQELKSLLYKQLEGTPEGGSEFVAVVRGILRDETKWVQWKRDGCPPFEKAPYQPPPPPARKRARVDAGGAVRLGTPDLDRLWGLTPDNLSCLSSQDRAPGLAQFLEPIITEMDPEQGIEEEYKTKKDKIYTWRALRLVAQQDLLTFSKAATAGDLDQAVRMLYPDKVPRQAAPAAPPPASPGPAPSTPAHQQDLGADPAAAGSVDKEAPTSVAAGSKAAADGDSVMAEAGELEAGEVQEAQPGPAQAVPELTPGEPAAAQQPGEEAHADGQAHDVAVNGGATAGDGTAQDGDVDNQQDGGGAVTSASGELDNAPAATTAAP